MIKCQIGILVRAVIYFNNITRQIIEEISHSGWGIDREAFMIETPKEKVVNVTKEKCSVNYPLRASM